MSLKLLNNRYQLLQALANGGFGQTFLAEDTHLPSRRRCVIKQLNPIANNHQAFPLIQQRFSREAAILEKLGNSHHQIPKLYAYFEEAGHFYLVQEWIEGQTLTEKVQREGKLNEKFVRNILLDILPVLEYVHSYGIIHRDIKPDNIILRKEDGKPVLIDFGAVKETMTAAINIQGNSATSMVIGTPGFMSPEQSVGKPIYNSDLYSLGLTAIYLLTGKIPQNLEVDTHTNEFVWRQYTPNINRNLAAVLDRAIRSHPRDRYSTPRQMLDALQSSPSPVGGVPLSQQATVAVSPGGASTQPVPITHQFNNTGEGKKIAIIAGSIIAVVTFIGIAIAKINQSNSPQPIVEKTTSSPILRSPSPTPLSSPSSLPIPIASPPVETDLNPPSSPPPVTSSTPRKLTPNPVIPQTPSPTPAQTTLPEIEEIEETSSPPPIISSPPQKVPQNPVISEIQSPTPTPEQPTQTPIDENPSPQISSSNTVPAFPVGTPEDTVINTLGNPTKTTKGIWKNTRAVLYEDYLPGEVSLGYLFDRDTKLLRQTEASFAPSVDSETISKTLNQMLGSSASREIKLQMERVHRREKRKYSFSVGSLKGEIERNNRDRIYIGIWEQDLH